MGTTGFLPILAIIFFSACGQEFFLEWCFLSYWGSSIKVSFLFCKTTLLFFFVVWMITSSMIFYSLNYMESDLNFFRFLVLKIIFVMSMFLMIFSANFFFLMLGWDGLGISSFLLVIYYNNLGSLNSGLITILTNRLGDAGFVVFMLEFLNIGSFEFLVSIFGGGQNWSFFMIFLLVMSCSTKSAQVPFSAWLPAAMSAPTPISSLVHSSTLVTAGLFVMYRFEGYLGNSFFLTLGSVTALMASMGALVEFDMKKVVALSTLSHLGIMMMMIVLDFLNVFMLHLIFHAFFKALLFMSMGLMIHLSLNYQDSRKIKNLFSFNFLNALIMVIAIYSLCGLPFLTGFFSKDFFLEVLVYSKLHFVSFMGILVLGVSSFWYSFRLMNFIIFSEDISSTLSWCLVDYLGYFKSMARLAVYAIVGGKILKIFLILNFNIIFLEMSAKMMILSIILGSLTCVLFFLMGGWDSQSSSKFFFYLMMNLVFLSRFFLVKKGGAGVMGSKSVEAFYLIPWNALKFFQYWGLSAKPSISLNILGISQWFFLLMISVIALFTQF